MPRVHHVKKARKDNPVCKKGESYYWWKFRYGGKRYSLTRPRPSQLTQSAYYASIRSLVEQIEDTDIYDNEDFTSLRDEIASELSTIAQECQESLDNMPDQLQYAPTGELLQERIDACENAQSEVESIDEFDEDKPEIADYDQDCPDCNGTGDNPDFDPDEEDREQEECSTCCGTGEGVIKEEYHVELDEYEKNLAEWCDNVKDELASYVSECEV